MHGECMEDIARMNVAVSIARIPAIDRKITGVCHEDGSLWPRLCKVS